MSFQHIAFPCLSLHGMVWIVTLRSQCNYWANSQACTAACSERRLCFCLSKQTLSIFDVRFVWVSNNRHQREELEWLGMEQRDLHKMNKMLPIGPHGSGEASAEQRDNTDRISQRDIYCIFMRRFCLVMCSLTGCLWLGVRGRWSANLHSERWVTRDVMVQEASTGRVHHLPSNSSHGTLTGHTGCMNKSWRKLFVWGDCPLSDCCSFLSFLFKFRNRSSLH